MRDRCSESSRRSLRRREIALARRRRRRIFAAALIAAILATLAFGIPRALQPVMDRASASQPRPNPASLKPSRSASDKQKMSVSPRALAFIADFEGFFPRVYNDPVGHCTIGYGTLLHLGECTDDDRSTWGTITRPEALSLMRQELAGMETRVKELVKVPLRQHQYEAILSFAYNCGIFALERSTLLSLLNKRIYRKAADQLLRWNRADGQVFEGLSRRRAAERKLFISGW